MLLDKDLVVAGGIKVRAAQDEDRVHRGLAVRGQPDDPGELAVRADPDGDLAHGSGRGGIHARDGTARRGDLLHGPARGHHVGECQLVVHRLVGRRQVLERVEGSAEQRDAEHDRHPDGHELRPPGPQVTAERPPEQSHQRTSAGGVGDGCGVSPSSSPDPIRSTRSAIVAHRL